MKIYVDYSHSNARNLLEKYFKQDCPKTYQNYSCTLVQCLSLRSRSIDDLIYLVRTYYPKVSDERICKILIELYNKRKIESLYCPDLCKPVFFTKRGMYIRFNDKDKYNGVYFRNLKKSIGTIGYGMYSFQEILDLANG